jgi:hypothetical protein
MARFGSAASSKAVLLGVVGVAAGGYLTWVFHTNDSYAVGVPLGVLGGAAAALVAYLPLALLFSRSSESAGG